MTSADYNQYFRLIYERVNGAERVPFREVSIDGWRPALNKCHDNVDHWVGHYREAKAVRGWIFWPPDETGRCNFMAHSVVDENGVLFDITPIDTNTPRAGLLFLPHHGTEGEFEQMKSVFSTVLYPPITPEEWQETQPGAETNWDEA